jgi:CheY-like chemotaxis protein
LRHDLGEIGKAGRQSGELTQQLLAFSRRQVLQPKVVNLNDAIAGMTKMLHRIIGEDIELSVRPGPNLGSVLVDPSQIEQVLLNLVVNARDVMPRGGQLVLETGNVELDQAYAAKHVDVTPGSYVFLRVTDTGKGIDPAIRERIFEPFFTTKERGKGTGLGLSTVYGIVKQSGGHISVDSEPGRGTSFMVYLPHTNQRPSDSKYLAAPADQPGSETVLLVEDDEQVRALTVRVLRRYGYDVLEASSGAEAVQICERHAATIHLVLTDVVMPKMSGRELWERISKTRPGTKVLFMSGYTDDAVLRHGVLGSEFAFIQKPLTPKALLAKIRSVLDSAA